MNRKGSPGKEVSLLASTTPSVSDRLMSIQSRFRLEDKGAWDDMGALTTEEIAELLMLPEDLQVQAVFSRPTSLTLRLICTADGASCPSCQTVSQRLHGHYGRTLADLPCAGRRVVLALTVRKFVCTTANCPCRIFTERLPKLTQPYARVTNRLRTALEALGLAASGEAGARVAERLGIPVTPFRLLQSVRKMVLPLPTEVRIVGIDDWCWEKGATYGTIIVDLERRQPIELLPDRSVETVVKDGVYSSR
ncbi:MAG: transposase [Ktedonobacteraceae bacterium]|nr:transposase [Ktedonobacteraceae bacterium]